MGEGPSKMGYYHWQPEDDISNVDTDSDRGDNTTVLKPSARPSDTVIIFDWDDTLLCSSAINMQKWTPLQLRQLEAAVESILQTAISLGETMIVTNGNATWVQDSTKRFFPNLQPTLDKITVMSARAGFEHAHPGDPFGWKRAAFKDIFEKRNRTKPGSVNLVILGDSMAEIQAAQFAIKTVLDSRSLLKTVKFKETPTADELLGQVRRAGQELSSVVELNSSCSRELVPRQPSAAHLASWASGWRFNTEERRSPIEAFNLSWLLPAIA